MTAQSRALLYTYFETGDFPTQAQFQNLIDSALNLAEVSAQVIASDVSALGKMEVGGALTVKNSAQTNLTGNVTIGGTLNVSAAGGVSIFSAITITGLTTPTGGVHGNALGSNALAGNVGEYKQVVVSALPALASAGSITTVATLPLTAGDWDVYGNIVMLASATPTVSVMFAGIASAAGSIQTGNSSILSNTLANGATWAAPTPTTRFNINTSANVFLTAGAVYDHGVMKVTNGILRARRVQPG